MARFQALMLSIVICLSLPSLAFSQQGGGDTGGGGGNTGGGNTGGDTGGFDIPGGNTQGATDPIFSGNVSEGTFQPLDLQNSIMDISLPELEIVNQRLQPFVGPSSENVVHPRSQIAGGNAGGGNNAFANLFGNQFGNQPFGTGQQNGFEVVRRGLRSRVVPLILDRSSSDLQVSQSFVSRVQRISALGDETGNVNITVSNYTATLAGTVRTQQQKDLIERMTRLEPGIYQIDNQIVVSD